MNITSEEWKKWDELKRFIAAATYCGWRRHYTSDGHEKWVNKSDPYAINHDFEDIPHYLEDLNAMHEAEKNLTGLNRHTYIGYLNRIVCRDDSTVLNDSTFATAVQRAEAFVLTMTAE